MIQTLTIIIPAFNESKRILRTLDEIDSYIQKRKLQDLVSVIVINDGSLDDTELIIQNWISNTAKNKNLFQVSGYAQNQGKGYAVNQGISKATGDLILYIDADGAAPIEELEKLLSVLKNGFDVVIGSRVIRMDNSKVKMSFLRRFTGRVFHTILSLLKLAEFKDTQCGFKLFKSSAAKKLAQYQQCFGFSFDIEYLFLLKNMDYKIKEVPINWCHVPGSKVNLLRDSIKMLIEVLKIRFIYKYNLKT